MMENNKNIVLNTISNEAFFLVNKAIVHEVGHVASILLADLISKYKYFKNNNQLCDDDSFYNTSQMIENDTCITAKQRRTCQKKLENAKLLKVVKRGLPARNFYYINWENVIKCLSSFEPKKYEKMSDEENLKIIDRVQKTQNETTSNDIIDIASGDQMVVTASDQKGTEIKNNNKKQNKNKESKIIVDKSTSSHHRTISYFSKLNYELNKNKLKIDAKEANFVKKIINLADNDLNIVQLKIDSLYNRIVQSKFIKGAGLQPSTLYLNWNELDIDVYDNIATDNRAEKKNNE